MERQTILLILLIIILGGISFIWYQYLSVFPAANEAEPVPFEAQVAELERLATVELSLDVLEDLQFQALEEPPAISDIASSSIRHGNPFLPF